MRWFRFVTPGDEPDRTLSKATPEDRKDGGALGGRGAY